MNELQSNLGALLLSLILAIAVWVIAVQDENPIITADFETPIPITIIGPDKGLAILGQPIAQVTLTIRAPKRVWEEKLRPQDFIVTADLSGLGPGQHSIPLTASYPGEQVEVLEIKPQNLVVTLETIETRQVPVQAEVVGEPAFGYEWRSTEITPTQVTITGSKTLVDQVKTATVEIVLGNTRSTLHRIQPVTLRDARGEPVTGISSISPPSVAVTVTVAQRPGYRDFSVRVPYRGNPAPGYQITGIVVDPSLVTLRGSPDAFDQLPGYVETLPIDINNATDDINAQVALNLPESLAAVGLNSVSVRIQVDPILASRAYEVEPVIRGLGPGLTRTVPLRTVDVVVSGPLPILDTLGNGLTQVIADLSGLGPGVHAVRLTPVVPEGLTVVSLFPEQVNITIAELPTPTPTPTVPITTTIAPTTTVIPTATIQPTATRVTTSTTVPTSRKP